jgi:signal transduction histidine kinase
VISRRSVERWIASVRLAAVVLAVAQVGLLTSSFPPHFRLAAWMVTVVFALVAPAFFVLAGRCDDRWLPDVGAAALVFDTAIVWAYGIIFTFEYGNQMRWATIFVLVEAALRYGLAGGIGMSLLACGYFAFNEWWRAHYVGPPSFKPDRVAFPAGVLLLTGLILGWLVRRLELEARQTADRAAEAERLRDEIARRVDVLEAANRCARALGSSLEMERAFGAFIREVRGLIPFARTAIVLVEGETARTIATAGVGATTVFPPGSTGPLRGSVLERVLTGEVVVRGELEDHVYPEDTLLLGLGLNSELVVPLVLGARPIGMISISRAEPAAFTAEEIELLTLLGRLVATAVQNIRSYEAERQTVEELRRLSALRADFVSLVSHELRSPMAAVIGAARTLEQRWRTLAPGQREAFLALIADETNRLAALIGDVLDTSRIEAGTFSYSFSDVDLSRLVQDAVSLAALGQDEVRVSARVPDSLPRIRGDRERLRQVLANLIDNAVKYSPSGDSVEVSASQENGTVRITVSDHGPGIPAEQQRIIFEKFGRAEVPGSKPGTGLGLFIARSIAEAHGGTLDVTSHAEAGATFTLTLPLSAAAD